MKAWKTVDAEHADLVARGALRIGALAEYVALEHPALAAKAPPCWVFCMTEPGWRMKDAAKPRVIFEISDVPLLSRYIMQHFAVQMQGAGHGPIRYGARPSGSPTVDPFLKAQDFAAEREMRVVFDPRPGVDVDGPLLIKPDYSIAALFKRVE